MDVNLFLKELEVSVELENKFINCYTEFKKSYSDYKKNMQNSIETELQSESKDITSNLELIIAYINKHQEVKTIYNSYKLLLKKLLEYREKMKTLTRMSKPLISDERMGVLIDEQLRIQKLVNKINNAFDKEKDKLPNIN